MRFHKKYTYSHIITSKQYLHLTQCNHHLGVRTHPQRGAVLTAGAVHQQLKRPNPKGLQKTRLNLSLSELSSNPRATLL